MADPRYFQVKQCGGAYAARSAAVISASTSSARTFFNLAGKVGDLNVLNSVGASKIGQGLRTLASISNTIRSGCGALPTSIGGAIGSVLNTASATATAGTDWVLNQVGMSTSTVDAVKAFNPTVANAAWGQAQTIYSDVRAGNFTTSKIPSALQDLQNLEQLARGIYTPSNSAASKMQARCAASPYMQDLIARAPKLKFQFAVQIIFNPGYDSLAQLDASFMIKKTTRPSVKYVMQDVNYYNFRSHFITRTEFDEMQMTFHDEAGSGAGYESAQGGNSVLRVFRAYMQATSPITNAYSNGGWVAVDNAEQTGMLFNKSGTVDQAVTYPGGGSSGPLAVDATTGTAIKTIIQEIRMYHLYAGGRQMDVYHFYNPRVSSMTMDDLDQSAGGETSECTMHFTYDSVGVETGVDINSTTYNLAGQFPTAVYPLRDATNPSSSSSVSSSIKTASASASSSC